MDPSSQSSEAGVISFGPFVLDCPRALLTRDGVAVPLRPKTFALLCTLTADAGRVVGKQKLLAAAWPGLVVTDDSGEVVGVISHMDVIPLYGQDLSQFSAAEVMTHKVICVAPTASVREAIEVMVSKRIHRLVVTRPEGNQLMPVGVLSTTDIVRDMRGFKWSW